MRRIAILSLLVLLASIPAYAHSKEQERLREAGAVLKEILDIPENIPQDLLDKAECAGVLPSVKKGAFIFGGSYGAGAFLCRSGENFDGPWGAPAMYRLEGGSFGLQIGGSETDFVLLIMNKRGAETLLKSKAKLGADAAAAAGPKGRTAAAGTDLYMRAEILTYSRSRGLFAGVSLEGSTLRPDRGANDNVYGRSLTARQILREGAVKVPGAAQGLVNSLNQHSPRNLSD